VLIRATAEGTETFELNRNLLLTRRPAIRCQPGDRDREIAGAGHASATGRSTTSSCSTCAPAGIPETVARRLVVRGFFNEIIQPDLGAALRERLERAVEDELAAMNEER